MNKRLVWNFELMPAPPLVLPPITKMAVTGVHWESRFFWAESAIIVLSGLEDHFLDVSNYKIKHRVDQYFLMSENTYNLKIRRDELVYKPVIQRRPSAIAYGKKIKLNEQTEPLLGENGEIIDPVRLLRQIQLLGSSIQIEKEALMYTFQSHPKTRFELARLMMNGAVYFSLSIESPELSLVEYLTEHLMKNNVSSDYVSFLQQHFPS